MFMDTKIHLCNTCERRYSLECMPDVIEFGDGLGNDNIIQCVNYVLDDRQ
jgi:hypothetical protein